MGLKGINGLVAVAIAMAAPMLSGAGCGREGKSMPGAANRECGRAAASKARAHEYPGPRNVVASGEKLTAVVHTSCGAFLIALDAGRFPSTVNSFVFLARKGFYDGMPFNRAGAHTVLYGGDPRGAASGPGYRVQGKVPDHFIYRHGTVAMWQPANAPPGRVGSQFFIVIAKPWLDFSTIYAPLGTIVAGYDVLDRISRLGPASESFRNPGVSGPIGRLGRPVVIEGISIRPQ